MRWQKRTERKSYTHSSLYLKCGAIFLLFLLSVLIVACGGNGTDTNLGEPPVTVTVNLGQFDGSPTPPLPAYTCSAWVTNTTPGINSTSSIGVYAKFVHNVDNNPEGVYPASATATVLWPDGNVYVSATTTQDGLAVFSVSTANRAADLNKIILVTVNFTASDGTTCVVNTNRAAYFTLVVATSTITGSPTASPTPCRKLPGGAIVLKRTPTPTKTPTPCH
jgi:hypothetical protein